MSDILNIVVRIMPGGDEVDVELPRYATGHEIKEELLNAEVAPRKSQNGEPYFYDLISKSNSIRIEDNKTLHDLGIKDGETILFVPEIVPG